MSHHHICDRYGLLTTVRYDPWVQMKVKCSISWGIDVKLARAFIMLYILVLRTE